MQLTHFELTYKHGTELTADIQIVGADPSRKLTVGLVEHIHIAAGAKRYDFNGCYITNHTVERGTGPITVDMTIEAMEVNEHE